jgi:hypothetical protein
MAANRAFLDFYCSRTLEYAMHKNHGNHNFPPKPAQLKKPPKSDQAQTPV